MAGQPVREAQMDDMGGVIEDALGPSVVAYYARRGIEVRFCRLGARGAEVRGCDRNGPWVTCMYAPEEIGADGVAVDAWLFLELIAACPRITTLRRVQYEYLTQLLAVVREEHDGQESVEEDAILNRMDVVWAAARGFGPSRSKNTQR